jgi:hypothetical protein
MDKIKIIIFISIILLFGACDADTNDNNMTYDSTTIIKYDPVFDENIINSIYDGLKIVPETDYSNISAELEKNMYYSTEVIKCHIINNNLGKGFGIFSVIFVDYKYDDKWIRLGLETTEYPQWLVIGEENNNQIYNETYLELNLSDIKENLVSGEYRVVIYVGNSTLYIPFKITVN